MEYKNQNFQEADLVDYNEEVWAVLFVHPEDSTVTIVLAEEYFQDDHTLQVRAHQDSVINHRQSPDRPNKTDGTLYATNIRYQDFRLPRIGDIYLVSVGLYGTSTELVFVATSNHSTRRQPRYIIGNISQGATK